MLLNEFQFDEGLLEPLRLDYLTPLTSLLFPSWGGHCLDSHKAFTVTYELNHDRDLSCHYDNAEVTLNVALSGGYTGGDLYFLGANTSADSSEVRTHTMCAHRRGWGVLHRGKHMHGAEPLLSGKRCNLIVWMRSSRVRNARCPMCEGVPDLLQVAGLDDGFRSADVKTQGQGVVDVCQML